MIGIYKITNPKSKIYIGQSRSLEKRELQYSKYTKRHCRQLKLVNSIKKYGWDLHKFEIIEECYFEDLNNRERYWQEYYDSINNGLNCIYTKTTDKPAVFGNDTRIRMSKSQKGKKLTDATKEKISKSKKGVPLGVGKKLSNNHKQAISNSLKKKFNEEQIYDINKLYLSGHSLRKISIKYNTSHSTISNYINNKQKL